MKQIIISLSIILVFTFSSNAQFNQMIGVEAGLNVDYYSIPESEKNIQTTPQISGTVGITFELDIHHLFSIESGFLYKEYTEGYGYDFGGNGLAGHSSNGLLSYQIPIRFLYNHKFGREDGFIISPFVGGRIVWNDDFGFGGGSGSGSFTSGDFTLNYSETTTYDFHRIFPLIEYGARFNIELGKKMRLHMYLSSINGFLTVTETSLQYFVNTLPGNTTITGKGNHTNIGIGIKYKL